MSSPTTRSEQTSLFSGGISVKMIALGIALVVVAGLAFQLRHFGPEISQTVSTLAENLAERGPFGVATFAVCAAVWIALWLPASVIFLVSGAVWGLKWGLGLALLINFTAGVIGFALAKTFLSGRSSNEDPRDSKQALIRSAVQEEGLRGAFLLRFSALPVSAISYGLGAAGLSWKHFLLASFAIVPTTWVWVAAGHAAGMAAGSSPRSPEQWALLGAGVVATLAVMVLLGRRAKAMLDDTLDEAAAES